MRIEVDALPYNPADEKWRDRAKCKGFDVEEFFPPVGVNIRHLKEFCSGCSVAYECVEYAVKYNLDHGVWGGTSMTDRRAIRAGRMKNPHATVRR